MRAKRQKRGLCGDAPIAPKLHKRPSHAPWVALSTRMRSDKRVIEACDLSQIQHADVTTDEMNGKWVCERIVANL